MEISQLATIPIMAHLFLAIEIGPNGGVVRQRANEIDTYIVEPVAKELGLEVVRADKDPTPGPITSQMLRSLLDASVVIADLTNRNPNVYYELAVAHSFVRPVVLLVDDPKNIAFDTKDERVIPIGEYKESLSVQQAEAAKNQLREALNIALSTSYQPKSAVTEVAGAQSLDALAPENPVASELAVIREDLTEIKGRLTPQRVVRQIPPAVLAEYRLVRELLASLVQQGAVSNSELYGLLEAEVSKEFRHWVEAQVSINPFEKQRASDSDSWGSPPTDAFGSVSPRSVFTDEPPF